MAISFPLPLNDFFLALPILNVKMAPHHQNEISRTRGGQHISAYNGPTLWAGTVTLGQAYNADARAARALLSLAQHYDASFIACDPAYTGPRRDARGTGGARLAATPNNMRDIQITGLPANFRLSSGDMLSWQYGANPQRYAFHSVLFDRQANSDGAVTVEVTPVLKTGSLQANAPVELQMPRFRAKITPGTVDIGTDASVISAGSSFGFEQIIGE